MTIENDHRAFEPVQGINKLSFARYRLVSYGQILAPLRLEDFKRFFKETGYWIFALQSAQDEYRREVFGRKMDSSLGRELIDEKVAGRYGNAATVLSDE
jgi:hypothetical protein